MCVSSLITNYDCYYKYLSQKFYSKHGHSVFNLFIKEQEANSSVRVAEPLKLFNRQLKTSMLNLHLWKQKQYFQSQEKNYVLELSNNKHKDIKRAYIFN